MSNPRPLLAGLSRLSIPVEGFINSYNAQRWVSRALPFIARTNLCRVQARTYVPFTCHLKPQQRLGFGVARPLQLYMRGGIARQHWLSTGGGVSREMLASSETSANRFPTNAAAQNNFYRLLLQANMPAIVIERYQSGLYASNDASHASYLEALQRMGISSAIGTAASASPGQTAALTPEQNAAVQAAAAAAKGCGPSAAMNIPNPAANHAAGAQGSAGVTGGTKHNAIHVVIIESRGTMLWRWVRTFSFLIVTVYFGLLLLNLIVGYFEGVDELRRPGGRRANIEVKAESQKARFSDVHGCDEAKSELQETVEFLKNPAQFSTLGGKLPRGVLLVGPPGTGKTLLARAVAGESGVPFFYMSGSEFDEMYVGVGAKRVRDLFDAAKKKSPAIIFIDELDAVGSKRRAKDTAYMKQTLNQLLTEMDGFEQNSGLIVIAATNHYDALDKALTRPGRFDRHVQVDLPDVRGRLAILNHYAKKIKLGQGANLEAIASRTAGLSGAALENLINQAAVHASRAKAKVVTTADLEWAHDKILMGAERKMVITAKEKLMTAYHEAGHALANFYGDGASPNTLHKVTILPRGRSLGHTAFVPEMDKHSYTLADYMFLIRVGLGGKVAEEIAFGPSQTTSGVSQDLSSATGLAFRVVGLFGMSSKLGPVNYLDKYESLSSETRAQLEAEVQRIMAESEKEVRKLLTTKRTELDRLARALVMYETLDRDEVTKVVNGEKLEGRMPSSPDAPMTVPVPEPPPPFPPRPSDPSPAPPPPAPPPPASP